VRKTGHTLYIPLTKYFKRMKKKQGDVVTLTFDGSKIIIKSILLIIFFSLISFPKAEAGMWITKNVVELSPFKEQTVCLNIYQGVQVRSQHTISLSENLKVFVKQIAPNDFYLEGLPCPSNPEERRECLKQLCLERNETYCRTVCITLKGPFNPLACITDLFTANKSKLCPFAWNPQYVEFEGGIRDVAKAGASSIGVVYNFKVYYKPYDLKPIVYGFIGFLAIIITILIVKRKLKPKPAVYLPYSPGITPEPYAQAP